MNSYDIYFDNSKGRSILGYDGIELTDEHMYLCSATPTEIDDEIYKRECVNCEFRFAFEALGIDRLDEISNMFRESAKLLDAAAAGNEIAVESRLLFGADPNFRAPDGKTALMLAARHGYESRFGVVEQLLNAGASLAIKDNYGLTAFDYANEVMSEESWSPHIAELLAERANPHKKACLDKTISSARCRAASAQPHSLAQGKEIEPEFKR